jgi:hypothetical protein
MAITMPSRQTSPFGAREPGAYGVRPTHLATLVRQVAAKSRARVIAVHLAGAWSGGDQLMVDGVVWQVVRAGSALAVREALAAHEAAGANGHLVILTPIAEEALGLDVLARVARQRVWMFQPWELLPDLFRARGVDPRVARLEWLADVLMEHVPPAGFPPPPSGVLDLDTAWNHAMDVLLGLPTGAPDALTVLRWSTKPELADRWLALPQTVRDGVGVRIAESAGALGQALAGALAAGQGQRLVAIGLVADVLWPAVPVGDDRVSEALVAARVRLEPLVGGGLLPESAGRGWATLALRVLAELPAEAAGRQRREGEAILEELRAEEAVRFSTVLPGAAAARAREFSRAITRWLTGEGPLEAVAGAHAALVEHAELLGDPPRTERATMALRLLRALACPTSGAASGFAEAVRRYVAEGSWMDAARTALLAGDVNHALSDAYAALARRARTRREEESCAFAERLAGWNAHPAAEPEFLPVEHVLERFVAPVAEVRPVLLVLVDGLDLVVWRQFHEELATQGWTAWQPEQAPTEPVAISTLPSVTSCSRASLFAGYVRTGSQGTECADFAAHPALRRAGPATKPPLLFHKGDLAAGNHLAAEVRHAIADRQQRVVGAVVNAVDDWLDRSDQVLPRWSVGAVPLLDALFQEAAAAERAVIVLSDHGHLLDWETAHHAGGESARWRVPGGTAPGAGEVLVSGARIRAATGHDAIVLAWSETVRYTGRRTGYHGGASPQEVIVPVAVLSRDELGLDAWRPAVETSPEWWDGEIPLSRPAGMLRAAPGERRADHGLARGRAEDAAPLAGTAGLGSPARWINALLSSPVYERQRGLAGRTAPREEQIRGFLEILDNHQGRAPRAAVAAALGVPEIRVRGVLAGVRRVLNVEGFAVVEEEEATGTLTLNAELLRVQFGLPE